MLNILILITALNITNTSVSSKSQCFTWYTGEMYSKVVERCDFNEDDPADYQFIFIASNLFNSIERQRINEIFQNGHMSSKFYYEQQAGKQLLTNQEHKLIEEHFKNVAPFANKGVVMAQLLTAKMYYILKVVLKNESEIEPNYIQDVIDFDKYYIDNLLSVVESIPENSTLFYLLGRESVKTEFPVVNDERNYMSIKDEKLYKYLEKAAELKLPVANDYLKAVKNWNEYLSNLKEDADEMDPDSLFKLGRMMFYKFKEGNKDKLQQSLLYLEQAHGLKHINSMRLLQNLYAEMGEVDKSVELLKELVQLNDHEAMMKLGDVYFCNQDKLNAKKMYLKAKSFDNPLAGYALEDLESAQKPYEGCNLITSWPFTL